jgi:hypothetical protein
MGALWSGTKLADILGSMMVLSKRCRGCVKVLCRVLCHRLYTQGSLVKMHSRVTDESFVMNKTFCSFKQFIVFSEDRILNLYIPVFYVL